MIDHHCHILPAIDDGATDSDEALAMARLLAAAGFREVCCTPHCLRGSYDTTPERVRAEVAALQKQIVAAGVALRLQPGMEYYLDEFFLDLPELLPLGPSHLVLVEAPGQANAEVVGEGLKKVFSLGLTPLVAHPERTPIFNGADPAGKRQLQIPPGTLFQANLGSFTGFYGARVQRFAYDQLRSGRYTVLGSDAHDPMRLAGLLEAWQGKLLVNPVLQGLADPAGTEEAHRPKFGRLAWA